MLDFNKELVMLEVPDLEYFCDLDNRDYGDIDFIVKETKIEGISTDYIIVDKIHKKEIERRIKDIKIYCSECLEYKNSENK